MAVPVLMPRLGESVSEGTVTRWLKQEGERIEADEPLLEVSTDKVDTEIPSPAAGTIRVINVQEDETVEVGVELCVIDDGDGGDVQAPIGAIDDDAPTGATDVVSSGTGAPADEARPALAPAKAPEPPAAPPIHAPGPAALPEQKGSVASTAKGAAAKTGGDPAVEVHRALAPGSAVRGRTEPMSRLRRVIAQNMLESLRTSAQLTTVVEADVTLIARLHGPDSADSSSQGQDSPSLLPFFALAAIEALKAHPIVNAAIDVQNSSITYQDAVHLVVAVHTDRGLLAPVVHDADTLDLAGLVRSMSDVTERAHQDRLGPGELQRGTFTVTDSGSRGMLFETPIITGPNVAMLSTGAVVKRPVVVQDPQLGEVIAVRSMVYLALTYDHRIVDGADAARFLATVKERLEGGDFHTGA